MRSTALSVSSARSVISFKFPIGVETIYSIVVLSEIASSPCGPLAMILAFDDQETGNIVFEIADGGGNDK